MPSPWSHPTGLLCRGLAFDFTVPKDGWVKLPLDPVWYDGDQYLFQFVGDWNPPDLSGGFLWVRLRFLGKDETRSTFVGRAVRYYLKRDYQIIELPIHPLLRTRGFDAVQLEVQIGGKLWERTDTGEILLPKINVWEVAGY